MNKYEQQAEPDDSFSILFGLEAIRNELNPPPVDTELLLELSHEDGIEQDRFELALIFLESYESWRDAYRALVEENRERRISSLLYPSGP